MRAAEPRSEGMGPGIGRDLRPRVHPEPPPYVANPTKTARRQEERRRAGVGPGYAKGRTPSIRMGAGIRRRVPKAAGTYSTLMETATSWTGTS